jgi:hypothetical protein
MYVAALYERVHKWCVVHEDWFVVVLGTLLGMALFTVYWQNAIPEWSQLVAIEGRATATKSRDYGDDVFFTVGGTGREVVYLKWYPNARAVATLVDRRSHIKVWVMPAQAEQAVWRIDGPDGVVAAYWEIVDAKKRNGLGLLAFALFFAALVARAIIRILRSCKKHGAGPRPAHTKSFVP